MQRSQPLSRFVVLLLALGLATGTTLPCSTFVLRDGEQVIFGKNYDWHVDEGLVFVNQRGVARRSMAASDDDPAAWVSRFGSVTFNQYGRDFPSGGVNEAGLVIELMWLEGTRYPAPDERPALGVLEWIQYQLDRSADVADVIASDREVRIANQAPLHYLVADRGGAVATVEFLEGRLVAHTGKTLPVAALTNSRYDVSLRSLEDRASIRGRGSLDRFAIAARRVRDFEATGANDRVAYAFDTLRSVAQPGSTQWSIVYEQGPHATRLHFRTRRSPEVKTIDLSRLEFDCSGAVLWLDMHREAAGDATAGFEPYSGERNFELVRAAYRKTRFLADTPNRVIEQVAHHPATSRCAH